MQNILAKDQQTGVRILAGSFFTMTYYDNISAGYEELHKEEQMRKLRIIKDNLSISNGVWILDVGCGSGFSSELFENVVGVDVSFSLLKKNKENKIHSQAECLPFRDHVFDLVLCVTAIHHFDLDKALSEMKRVGKNDFVITVLKKSNGRENIIRKIKENFVVEKEVEEEKYIIYFLQSM